MQRLMGRPQSRAALPAILYVVGGGLFGASLVASGDRPLFAWLAIAALAAALHLTRSSLRAAGGVLVAQLLARVIGFPYLPALNRRLVSYDEGGLLALLLGEELAGTVPYAVTFGLAHRLCRGRLDVRWWLPIAWALAEALRYPLVSTCVDDWLNTQWTVAPVLRALARVGWWPLLLACLCAAAASGQALVVRRWRVALPGVLVVAGLAIAPPIADPGLDRLRGVAAIHTDSSVALPHRLPAEVELLIWPETALELQPMLSEGPGRGARIAPPLPGGAADHLLGLVTMVPEFGAQNQIAAVTADGAILGARAKRFLMPMSERRHLGVGRDRFRPGAEIPLLEIGERSVVPLICGEVQERALIAEGVQAGGELLVIASGDGWVTSSLEIDHLLAVQVLRSVEFGLPSVRASFGGQAIMVAADGRVLARSGGARNGVLTWTPEGGARDVDFRGRPIDEDAAPVDPPADIAVLYSASAPQFRTRCPEGRCSYHVLEDFSCEGTRSPAVVIAGHGRPPEYLALPAAEVAAAARCFDPELVVMDTCMGASSELLSALGDLEAVVVATASLLPPAGMVYHAAFFDAVDPRTRAAAVDTEPTTTLLRWRVDQADLGSLLEEVRAMDEAALGEHLARRRPWAVKVDLAGAGPVLVPIAEERLGAMRPPPRVLRPARRDRR